MNKYSFMKNGHIIKKKLLTFLICLTILVNCLLFALPTSVRALSPGDTIPTQMLSFNDPLSGKPVKRLTTMGKVEHIRMVIGDMSGEATNWSPDSQWISFSMEGHSSYNNGVYIVNANTGIIRYLAPCGDVATPTTYNKANPNEILYFYSYKPSEVSDRWLELRAVNVNNYSVRVIKRYSNGWRAQLGNQSYDGKWFYFAVEHGPDQPNWDDIYKQEVMINLNTSQEHPLWTYDPNKTEAINPDGAYWNPVTHNKALMKNYKYYNVDNSTYTTLSQWGAHNTWHPNGNWIVGDKGIRDINNNLLTPSGDTGVYGTRGHPFSNPAQASLGWSAKVITDSVDGPTAVLFEVPWSTLRDVPRATWKNDTSLRAGTWYGNYEGACHPHPQYSPDGSKVCFVSNIQSTPYGSPPGANDGLATSSDIFVITLGTSPTPTPTPTSTPTPTPGGGSVYQAEDASYGGGSVVENSHAGYYGTGFINFSINGGYLQFQNVDGGTGGVRTLTFRHALESGSRTGRIQINGGNWQDITFDATGSWSTWGNKQVDVTLNSGSSNTIRLESTGQDLANIDQLTVSGSSTPTPTPTPTPGGGTELLSNPGFESGTTSWSAMSSTIAQETSVIRSGAKSVKITSRSNVWDGVKQNIKSVLEANGQGNYDLSAWVRMESGSDYAKATLKVVHGGGTSYFSTSGYAVNSTSWAQASGTVNVTWSGSISSADFYVQTQNTTTNMYVDDCSLKKQGSLPTPTPTPTPGGGTELLSNPGFESGTTSWSAMSSTIAQETSVIRSGAKSVKITSRSNVWDGVKQNIKSVLEANGQGNYDLSAWVRMESGSDYAKATLKVVHGGGTSYFSTSGYAVNSTSWAQASGTVNVTWSGSISSADFYVQTQNTTTNMYVDDCSLKRK